MRQSPTSMDIARWPARRNNPDPSGSRHRPQAENGVNMRSNKHCGLIIASLMLAIGTNDARPAAAQSPADFYKGKTITITLGHPPGGSYDFYARLAADHLRRFIPGNPNLIVQHRPGGGGVAAVQLVLRAGAARWHRHRPVLGKHRPYPDADARSRPLEGRGDDLHRLARAEQRRHGRAQGRRRRQPRKQCAPRRSPSAAPGSIRQAISIRRH